MRIEPVTLSKTYAFHTTTFDRLEFGPINYPVYKALGEPGGYTRTASGMLMAQPDEPVLLDYAERLVKNVESGALSVIDDLRDIHAVVRAVRAPFVEARRPSTASDDGDDTPSTGSDGAPTGSTPSPSTS